MAELAASARSLGITSTAHMSDAELIEAIEQQRETNAVLRAEGESVPVPPQVTGG
ncbi:Rho termination factor [Saccharomonospora sp. CUA-673]|uniref:Rho termination factor n=1 Tax=Saccharomonospora sp. CUA-673 TaxID=1904969 RepID=UPI0011151F48|nr:Rho termination factor [Saccharomonospora sp. CUA-673]